MTIGNVSGCVVRGCHGYFQALFDSAGEVLLQLFVIRSHCELERSYHASADQPEKISRCFRVVARSLVIFAASFVLFVIELFGFQHNWDEGEGVIGASIIQCL